MSGGHSAGSTDLYLARRYLCEFAPGRSHRLRRRHDRGRRQHRWPAQDSGPRHRCFRGRDILSGLSQKPHAHWPSRREAARLGCASRPQGGDRESARRDMAALPRPVHAQCPRPCRQERPTPGLRVHCYGLRSGRCTSRPRAVARRRRSAEAEAAETLGLPGW
jgi:hypothetical protein